VVLDLSALQGGRRRAAGACGARSVNEKCRALLTTSAHSHRLLRALCTLYFFLPWQGLHKPWEAHAHHEEEHHEEHHDAAAHQELK
jgi:hypothetical protein